MKLKKGIACLFASFGIFLGLTLVEYFSIRIMIQGLNLYYLYELLIYLAILIVLNPMAVIAIIDQIPLFKEKRKATSNAH